MADKKPHTSQHDTNGKADVRGVFSTQEVRRVGTGTTTRKTVQKTFWFIEQNGKEIDCQPLNTNYVPSGPKRKITLDELIAKFSPEPEFYLNSVFPKMQEMQRNVENGDTHRDKGETFAIKETFKDHAQKLLISSTKSMTGHMLGAAGAVEAIASIMAVKTGQIPPTINYREKDPECDLNYVTGQKVEKEIDYALSNSLGFGGHNATVIFKKY